MEIALRYAKYKKTERREKILQTLKDVGLDGYEDKKVSCLSGGEQQRVALGRIMLKPSELILADEPTGSLDGNNRDRVMSILKKLNENGRTIMVVSHDPEVVKYADRTINIEKNY